MGPKINGSSVAELVSAAVDRQLEKKLDDYNNLLIGALKRIASLEVGLSWAEPRMLWGQAEVSVHWWQSSKGCHW